MSKKSDRPKREMTKRQLSHWQRENRIQRIAMLAGAVVILAVLVMVGTGIYLGRYKPLNAVVIKVGDKEYNLDYYIDMLVLYGLTTGTEYIPYVTDIAVQQIEQNELVIREAAKEPYSITVSDEEVNKTIAERKYPAKPAIIDAVRAELVLDKLKNEYFDKKIVPQTAEQRAVLAMFLESQSQVDAVKARLEKGESFGDIATELSRENNSKSKGGDFGWVPRGVLPYILGDTSNTVLEDEVFAPDTQVNVLTQVEDTKQAKNIGYWLIKITETRDVTSTVTPTPTGTETPEPTTETTRQVHLFAMLLKSEEEALQIKARLEAGEDFATLANEFSQYTNLSTGTINGGDLGWKSKGDMGTAIDSVIWPDDPTKALGANTLSNPVPDTSRTTPGGIWLIKVTGIEASKAIEGDNRTALVNIQLNNWLQKIWDDNQDQLQVFLSDEQKVYAVSKAYER